MAIDPIKLRKSVTLMKIEDRSWPCMLPFIKRTAPKKRFWFVERGSSLHLVVVTSSSLSPGSDAPTHPSDVTARHQHRPTVRARARAIRLRHAKRSTTARTWIVFVFLFLPCSPVSQVHSRVQTRRDAPIFKRAIVAAASDCRFENRSPASGGNSNPRETTSSMKVGTFAVCALWDQIWFD